MTKLQFNDGSELDVYNIYSSGTDLEVICIEIFDMNYHDIHNIFSDPDKTSVINVYNDAGLANTYSDYCSIKCANIDNTFYIENEPHTKTILYMSQICTKQKFQILSSKVDNLKNSQEKMAVTQDELITVQEVLETNQTIIEKKVTTIDQQLNPIFDVELMTLQELKEYKLKIFGTACTSVIYAGTDVETSLGIEHFSYTENDQQNIKSAFESVKIGLPAPYHADGKDCRIFNPLEIMSVYGTCELYKTYHTTYCNLMNNIIKSSDDIEHLKSLEYGVELPDEKKAVLEQNVQQAQVIFDAIKTEMLKAFGLLGDVETEEVDTNVEEDETIS